MAATKKPNPFAKAPAAAKKPIKGAKGAKKASGFVPFKKKGK